jgi:hypothetical protein
MPFQKDEQMATSLGPVYGEYLISYRSPRGQVRADLFARGGRVEAHVSFPTGVYASGVAEPYFSDLLQYAREQGFAERFHLIMS